MKIPKNLEELEERESKASILTLVMILIAIFSSAYLLEIGSMWIFIPIIIMIACLFHIVYRFNRLEEIEKMMDQDKEEVITLKEVKSNV